MQPGWLKQYFHQHVDGGCDHGVYEFAWSFNPLPLKGATGSPGNSVAIA